MKCSILRQVPLLLIPLLLVASEASARRTRHTPTATPTAAPSADPSSAPSSDPTSTANNVPDGFPTPPAIPPIPSLNSPVTISPGATFAGYTVYGDGVTDDTDAIQAALNTSDVIVAPATYAIAGSVSIPTGRNISCENGATFLDTQSTGTRMLEIGRSADSVGNNSIVGCNLQGTDSAADYSTFQGGTSAYSELLEISSGKGLHTDNVLIENDSFSNAQGDSIITYSPCGTNNTGGPCNDGAPGTEGPSNVFIVNDTVSHCAQPGVHLNGGQLIVVTGLTSTDCTDDDETDSNVQQVITSWWYNNKFTTQDGSLDPLNGRIYAPKHSCTGDGLIPEDDSGCYSYNNDIDGVGLGGPSILSEPPGCPGGGGHYSNESLTNGAILDGGC